MRASGLQEKTETNVTTEGHVGATSINIKVLMNTCTLKETVSSAQIL